MHLRSVTALLEVKAVDDRGRNSYRSATAVEIHAMAVCDRIIGGESGW